MGGLTDTWSLPSFRASRSRSMREIHAQDLSKIVPIWGLGLVRELRGSVGEVSGAVSMSLVLWGLSGAGVHPLGALGTGRETPDLP